jgi:hypothetical protein
MPAARRAVAQLAALLRRMVEAGCTILGYGSDLAALRAGYTAGLAELRAPKERSGTTRAWRQIATAAAVRRRKSAISRIIGCAGRPGARQRPSDLESSPDARAECPS